MKRLTVFATLFTISTFAMAVPEVILSPVDHLFVPKGFDNNDNVEVVVTGKFPNPCFIRNKIDVAVKEEKISITVTALKRADNNSELCEPMTVPFTEEILIGNLQGGDYEIVVNEGSRYVQKDQLNVAVSRSESVDDYLYPIVEYVELGFTGGLSGDAVLYAKTPSDCVVFDHVEYISNNKDTIAILPVMKKTGPVCNERRTRIEIPIRFNARSLPHSDVLLYVRSIEGKSVNAIIQK
jgi:hypothetical protein